MLTLYEHAHCNAIIGGHAGAHCNQQRILFHSRLKMVRVPIKGEFYSRVHYSRGTTSYILMLTLPVILASLDRETE